MEERPVSRFEGVVGEWLERIVTWVEIVVAAVLALVIVIAVVSVVLAATGLLALPPERETFNEVIKAVLDVFIVIELFRITVAYSRRHDVVPTVLETALVVAAREVVVIEGGGQEITKSLGVAGILLSIGVTWFLLRRVGVARQE